MKSVTYYAATDFIGNFVIGALLMLCYGCDVNERHIGIHAKFLVLFTACIRLAFFCPLVLVLFGLVYFKKISPYMYRIIYFIWALLYFPWAVYLVIRFFADDNHTKDEAGFLYAALLYLMIEGMIMIFWVLCITILLVVLCVLLCYIYRRNQSLENEQRERNARISSLINQLDVLNITGKRFSENDVCCIWLENYSEENVGIIQLPCAGKHNFHKECIIQWIDQSNTCPICKTEITEEILNSIQENQNILVREDSDIKSSDNSKNENYGTMSRNLPSSTNPPPNRTGTTSWQDTKTRPIDETHPEESKSDIP